VAHNDSQPHKHYTQLLYHRHAVAQHYVNGDRLSECETAKFDPLQIQDSSAG